MHKNNKRRNRKLKAKQTAKVEFRKKQEDISMKLESFGELRSTGDDGTFEGYLTVWETVDSYNSTFKRGSFLRTIEERGSKVKIFYDHEYLVGSSLELREDDHGVFGRGKLNLTVDKAKEAHAFMKDGTLEGLSFRFSTVKESFSSAGIRVIEDLNLFEYGPVIFPSNENANVISVRSEDFNESLTQEMLFARNHKLQSALVTTLDDIWWSSGTTVDNVMGKLDMVLSDYHAAYMEFAADWVKQFWTETRSAPSANELSNAFIEHLTETRCSIDDLAKKSSFTTDELQGLRCGALLSERSKLSELPESIVLAHQEQRSKEIENLCSQLRDGLTPVEKRRMQALLTTPTEERAVDNSDVLDYINSINKTLGAENA